MALPCNFFQRFASFFCQKNKGEKMLRSVGKIQQKGVNQCLGAIPKHWSTTMLLPFNRTSTQLKGNQGHSTSKLTQFMLTLK